MVILAAGTAVQRPWGRDKDVCPCAAQGRHMWGLMGVGEGLPISHSQAKYIPLTNRLEMEV